MLFRSSAFICHAFGMIAVGYFAMYLSGAFTEVDTDCLLYTSGRGFIPGRVDIDERPEIVELKERFGDLEIEDVYKRQH